MNRLKRTFGKIKKHYGKNDKIASLNDGKTYKYSGFLTLVGGGKNAKVYDSFNDALVVYKDGKLATVIEKGIDNEHIKSMNHIQNVRSTCKRLGCTPSELLKKNYMSELGYE
jgi:cytochrome b involved in lipid metabolism